MLYGKIEEFQNINIDYYLRHRVKDMQEFNEIQLLNGHRYKNIDKEDKFSSKKLLPVLFEKKEDCCGCGACYSVCPVRKNNETNAEGYQENGNGAISMEIDEEGFFYPIVDASLCIRCYRCIQVCPIKQRDIDRGVKYNINGEKIC